MSIEEKRELFVLVACIKLLLGSNQRDKQTERQLPAIINQCPLKHICRRFIQTNV